jgi:hypothetical protein
VNFEDATPVRFGDWLCPKCASKYKCKCGVIAHPYDWYRWGTCSECADFTIEFAKIQFEEMQKRAERAERDRDGYRAICYEHGLAS